MNINQKILSIPPYVSTSWKNISSIYLDEKHDQFILVVMLKNQSKINVPNLDQTTIEKIFECHAKYLELDIDPAPNKDNSLLSFGMPLKFGTDQLESIGSAMQHNPHQSNAPNLPPEIISKIASIVKILGIDESEHLPKPEPHCNCLHCQIAKAIQSNPNIVEENLDAEVSDEELRFKDWEIKQTGEQLYSVANPLDELEHYSVFLGEPIGCTCGKKDCEHIKAVLKS